MNDLMPFKPIADHSDEDYTAKFNLPRLRKNDTWDYFYEPSYNRMVRYKKGTNYRETRTHNVDLFAHKILVENNNSRYNVYVFNNKEEAQATFSWITGYDPKIHK